ncbi:hypothetical protein ACO2Q9_15475 [Variovorax sp. VNK109]|jgi:hypothetical protein|uniref:hypothetical protein n=1 Tax=Variovorax sp. VNK109 TaxID=3400919 RepID=UPI003BFBAFAD
MKGIKEMRWMLLGILALGSQASHAFFVTLDVMALPAAQVTANATMAAASQMTAAAKTNSEKEQATANANSAKQIQEAIKNAKDIMDQAHFFAKIPVEWAKTVKDYATIAQGWPKPADSATASATGALTPTEIQLSIEQALKAYGASTDKSGAQIEPNKVYVDLLRIRQEEMAQRSALLARYQDGNRDRQARMAQIEDLLNRAEFQRDYETVRTLLAFEQARFATEQSSFELSRVALQENAEVRREMMALKRQAEFSDPRLSGFDFTKPIPRVR